MPTFPRYESKGELTTRQPAAFVSKDTSGEITEAKGKVADTIQEGALKWSQAHDTIQKTVASANFKGGMADIQSRAAQDPLYNNSDQYYKEIEELKRNSLKGFTSKFTEMQTGLELGYEAKVGKIQIQNLYKKKEIDVGQANALKLLDIASQNPATTEKEIRTSLNDWTQAGIFDHKDAYKLEQEYVKQLKYNTFLSDYNSNPDEAAAKLSKNEYGFDSAQMQKANKLQRSMNKRQEEDRKKMQIATVGDLSQKLLDKSLTLDEVQNSLISGAIDAEMALNFELAMAGPDEWSKFAKDEEQGSKSKIITALLSKVTGDSDRLTIVKSALQNYNDKKINNDDLTFILRVANGKNVEPENPIWGFLKSAVGSLENTPGAKSSKFSADVMKKFSSRWDFKEDPREVIQQAKIDQQKEDRPETASYKIGDSIKRKSGSYEVFGFNEDGKPVFKKR